MLSYTLKKRTFLKINIFSISFNHFFKYKNNGTNHIDLPEFYEENDKIINIIILIENCTKLAITYNLKFLKNCYCNKNNCWHRFVICAEIKEKYLNCAELSLKINLTRCCDLQILYYFDISNCLQYILNFRLKIHERDQLKVFLLNDNIEIIRYQKSPIQAFWFYNSHQSDTFHYTMYYKDIYLAKKLYRGPIVFRNGSILQFLNPRGHILPRSLHPICFQFIHKYQSDFSTMYFVSIITLVLETNFQISTI